MFVITGGGSGIGQALAWALALRGQQVMVVGRSASALQKTAAYSSHITYHVTDVTQISHRARLVALLSRQSPLQALVHNAGVIDPIASIGTIAPTAWRACMTTNIEAPLFLTQALLPWLKDARILHMGSGAAYFPVAGWAAYCVSKAGLAMLTRCWQLEYPHLHMASVMPGIIDTPMQAKIRATTGMDAAKHDFFCRLKAADKLLSPATVALFLVWLLLDLPQCDFGSQEWDIYDTTHHQEWLVAPHVVPPFE